MMQLPAKPFAEGISAVVHTRNEAHRIGECLTSLQGWTDEIVVCDMESDDETVQIVERMGARVVQHPRIANFDAARNFSAQHAKHRWVFYLDADERVPEELGAALRHLASTRGDEFEALLIPFRHFFAGRWMQSLYPGYTAPRLLKNGRFQFNPRLHAGVEVDGRTMVFPAYDPNLAITHHSYDSLSHYLIKLNNYTDGESENMHRDGHPFHWQNAVAHFVKDFDDYYEGRAAGERDGVHGFIYSFLSAFYRFEQHAKLYERRFRAGQLEPSEESVPQSLVEIMTYALKSARQIEAARTKQAADAAPSYSQVRLAQSQDANAADILWTGPLSSASGYGEESREHMCALSLQADTPVAAQNLVWGDHAPSLITESEVISQAAENRVRDGFVQIIHTFGSQLAAQRHPNAGITIARTMFETDRLPQDWVNACNTAVDRIWVPSQFNKETFTASGVDPNRISVVPECLDAEPYAQKQPTPHVVARLMENSRGPVFLSVFDWTIHKGWDVILRAFLEEFAPTAQSENKQPILLLKVWSSLGYPPAEIERQATAFLKETLNVEMSNIRSIKFIHERLTRDEMIGLYQAADCYVMPSRGEGWGRPYMEAMACGLPTIGTNWSGNTEFMYHEENSFLIRSRLSPVPQAGWQELPTYKGHRWAEPDALHLRELMRRVVEQPQEAARVGRAGAESVKADLNPARVGKIMLNEIASARASALARVSPAEEAADNDSLGKVSVRWEGPLLRWHSLAHVNREACSHLLATKQVELSIFPTEPAEFAADLDPRWRELADQQFAPLSKPADVHIKHQFPPRWEAAAEGHFVLMQPWEYGFIPTDWVDEIKTRVSEVWCNSSYVKRTYLASGVPESKLHLVPLGIDPTVFRPDALPYILTDEPGADRVASDIDERFVFLYVGGTIHRKGFDILLEAYTRAFSADDPVCLMIKDVGVRTVYAPNNARAAVLDRIDAASGAPIVYIDSDLTPRELAGVYASANSLIAPYRGEGFCLPVLEAMACGTAVVVPIGGATDDFVDDAVGWQIEAEHKTTASGKRIGEWECAGQPWMLEVSPGKLAQLMRQIAADPQLAKDKGVAGAERARENWTWKQAARTMLNRLRALQRMPVALEDQDAKCFDATVSIENNRRLVDGEPQCLAEPKVSLCMIVRNEERVLGDCLRSISPWVDEIIVVDTGSSDATREIAAASGARVFDFPWSDSFSVARNESIRHATGDWILWMDADDTIPAECGERLRDLVFNAPDDLSGYIMQVRIPPGPGQTGMTVVDHVKLFRNQPEVRFEGRIHEQILEPIYRAGGTIARSDLYVVHSGYDYSPEGQARKRKRDLRLLQKEIDERPDHPFVLFNIGMTAYYMKDYPKAQEALQRCLQVAQPQESIIRKVFAMLAGCSYEQGDVAAAKEIIDEGLSRFPNDPELLFRAGAIYKELGQLAGAEQFYLMLLQAPEVGHIDSIDVSITTYKAHHNLATVYADAEYIHAAEHHWKQALACNEQFVPSLLGLGELYGRTGQHSALNGVLARLKTLDSPAANELARRMQPAPAGVA